MSMLAKTWSFAAIAFLIDQVSKYWIVFGLDLINVRVIEVVPPYLVFAMGWNYGINFGLFGGSGEAWRWILTAIAFAVSALLSHWAHKAPSTDYAAAYGLIIGGALGNALDRIVHGAVADFLNMSCCGIRNPYTFNIADIFIFAGVGLLIYISHKDDRKRALE